MPRFITSGVIALACTLLAAACDEGELCGCTPAPEVAGAVSGVVFMPDSTPIALARVELNGSIGSCDAAGEETWSRDDTDDDGSYGVFFDFHGVGGDDVCVIVQAFPPTGLAFGPSVPLTLVYPPDRQHHAIEERHDFYLTAE